MIQRIQTIYLLGTFILSILFLSGEIISFSNGTFISISGIHEGGTAVVHMTWVFTVLLLIIPLLSLIVIFLYGNRKMQIRITNILLVTILLMIGAGFYYAYDIINESDVEIDVHVKLAFPVFMLIFTLLALRGIRKDEAIVRSYDRLR